MLAHSFDPVLLHAIHAPVESIKPVPARSLSLSGVLHAEKDQKMSEVRFCRSINRFFDRVDCLHARALRRLCRDKSSNGAPRALHHSIRRLWHAQVFKNMSEQGLISLPVVTKLAKRFFHQFIDLWDVCDFVCRNFVDWHYANYEEFDAEFQKWSLRAFRNATVGELVAFKDKEFSVHEGFSFMHCMEIMARTNAARVCIVNDEQLIKTVVTRSSALNFLYGGGLC